MTVNEITADFKVIDTAYFRDILMCFSDLSMIDFVNDTHREKIHELFNKKNCNNKIYGQK